MYRTIKEHRINITFIRVANTDDTAGSDVSVSASSTTAFGTFLSAPLPEFSTTDST